MSHRVVLFTGFLFLVVAMSHPTHAEFLAPAPEKPEKPALAVAIAIPINHNQRSIHLGTKQPFHVVVTNTSDKPLKLWREWCSWGYFNLTFEIDDGTGKVVTLKKKPRGWDKNYPDFQVLEAGDHHVIPVTFDANVWELPFAKAADNKPRQVKMRAVYEIQPDAHSKELGVWTGTVRSAYQTYAIWGNP